MSTVTSCGKIGILYPGRGAEDDSPTARQGLDPDVDTGLAHTAMPVAGHRVDVLRQPVHEEVG